MISVISKRKQMAQEASDHLPAISITLPFEPKMCQKSELEQKIKSMLLKVEALLSKSFSKEHAMPILHKLQVLIHNLNYYTHKRSIIIFVSPLAEKVLYLDFQIGEKITVGEFFRIRDLLFLRKQSIKCLLLLLNAKASKMYYSNCSRFILIKSNIADTLTDERELQERSPKFQTTIGHAEKPMATFANHMDEGLSLILKSYPLPVFVIGENKMLKVFKKLTRNSKSIVKYIKGNYLQASEAEIRDLMLPYITEWEKIKWQNILQQLKYASKDHKLATGVNESWAAALHKNIRLLVVEKDFMHINQIYFSASLLQKSNSVSHNPSYIGDTVDAIIEKVLENGGDVELVDHGALKDFGRIAIVKYY